MKVSSTKTNCGLDFFRICNPWLHRFLMVFFVLQRWRFLFFSLDLFIGLIHCDSTGVRPMGTAFFLSRVSSFLNRTNKNEAFRPAIGGFFFGINNVITRRVYDASSGPLRAVSFSFVPLTIKENERRRPSKATFSAAPRESDAVIEDIKRGPPHLSASANQKQNGFIPHL